MGWGNLQLVTHTRDSLTRCIHAGVTPVERGRFRLELRGPLPNEWAARLSHHLREAGIDVQQALAVRDGDGCWTAEIDCWSKIDAPAELPWVEWLSREPRGTPHWSPTLTDHRLTESGRHQGSLELRVLGVDVPGFLSGLLRPIRQLGLTPVALDVRTELGRCDNRLWLRASGGGPVTSGARTRLEVSLARAVERGRARVSEGDTKVPPTAP